MTYAELKPLIVGRLPGNVPPGLLALSIQGACRKFCSDTWYWSQTLADIDIVADQQDYDLSSLIPENSEIETISTVKIDGGIVDVNHIELYQLSILRFKDNYIPSKSSTGGLSVKVILKPSMVDDALPEWIVTQWQEAISYASLVDITSIPNRSSTDLNASAEYRLRYEREVSRAKTAGKTGNIDADISVITQDWL